MKLSYDLSKQMKNFGLPQEFRVPFSFYFIGPNKGKGAFMRPQDVKKFQMENIGLDMVRIPLLTELFEVVGTALQKLYIDGQHYGLQGSFIIKAHKEEKEFITIRAVDCLLPDEALALAWIAWNEILAGKNHSENNDITVYGSAKQTTSTTLGIQ